MDMATAMAMAGQTIAESRSMSPGRLLGRALKLALILLVTGPLLWLVVMATAPGVFRGPAPATSLRVAPFDSRSLARLAQLRLQDRQTPASLAAAQSMSVAALRRDPMAIDAITTLGLVAALRNQPQRALQAFAYAERLSRRDAATQLWLLENRVQQNDIRGALRHYDTILRTSHTLAPTLEPILASASADPNIAVEINRVLRHKPIWTGEFVATLLTRQNDPRALYLTTERILDPSQPYEHELLTRLLDRLTELEALDLAWNVYRQVYPARPATPAQLFNEDFSREPGLGPFDWEFPGDAALAPERRVREGTGDFALLVPLNAASTFEAARQLVKVSAGLYRIEAAAGSVPESAETRPSLIVRCAARSHAELARIPFPIAAAEGRTFGANIQVGADCSYLWVTLSVPGALDPADGDPAWISYIRLRRG